MFYHKLMIGNVELNNNLLLAPMAGVTDLAFRKICKKCGAGLVEAEMVSAKAIFYGDDKTISMLNTDGEKGFNTLKEEIQVKKLFIIYAAGNFRARGRRKLLIRGVQARI